MNKKIIIIALLLMFCVSSAKAVLVDSENFQSYTVGWKLENQSAEWDCYSGLYALNGCTRVIGSPSAASGGHSIMQEGSNKYLNIYALGGETGGADFIQTALKWQHTNSSTIGTLGTTNYSMTLKFRISTYQDDNVNGTENRYIRSGFGTVYGNTNDHVLGGISTGCEGDCQLNLSYRTADGAPPFVSATQYNTDCQINDYDWHDISIVHFYNSSLGRKQSIWMYIDGVLCEYATSASWDAYSGGLHFWEDLYVTAQSIFSIDIDDIYLYENQTEIAYPYDCDDGVDNDGDGYTDYPADPSCTSLTDDTESPYDYTQCNNGIDDDGDGFTDYPADPSCSSLTDTTETPKDATSSVEDTCLVEEGCILRDTFPYSDELSLHGWSGTGNDLVSIYGNYKMYFDTNSNTTQFNLTKNVTNPNIYSDIVSRFTIYVDVADVGVLLTDAVHTFYYVQQDSLDREMVRLKFDVSRISPTTFDFVKVELSNYNGSNYSLLKTYYMAHNSEGRLDLEMQIDQVLKQYSLYVIQYDEAQDSFESLPTANILASKVEAVNIYSDNFDDSKVEAYLDEIRIFSDDILYDTVCDEWDLPYYLVESFNGNPTACGWSSNRNIYFPGEVSISNLTADWWVQKYFPNEITADQNRYVTIDFEAGFDSIAGTGSTTFRLYDYEGYNFLTTYWRDSLFYYYNSDGTGVVAQGSIPFGKTYDYRMIIDMQQDVYDIFFNGTEVVSNAAFNDDFYNLEIISAVKINARYSDFNMDNLQVFASDEDGNPVIPDDDITPDINTETVLCGHVYRDQGNCITDADCPSALCLPNNKCARFDKNYCDEKGLTYGNACFLGTVAYCTLDKTGELILGNFLLFLVLIIIIIGLGYLVYIFKFRG